MGIEGLGFNLSEGYVEIMGDDHFVVRQVDEYEVAQTVCINRDDLERMLAAAVADA